MQTKIFTILSGDIPASHFIRIGNNRNINIYVGRDEYGRYSFDFRGSFKISKTKSSEIISVSHINCNNDIFLRFSLERPSLLEYFCTFCEDLMSSCLASESERELERGNIVRLCPASVNGAVIGYRENVVAH